MVYAPLVTWTRTLATSAFEGEHEYFPESAKSAFCMSKCDIVTSAFSVITDTPPRAESKFITCTTEKRKIHELDQMQRLFKFWTYFILMIPKNVCWWLCTVINCACDVYHTPLFNENLWCTPNDGRWYWCVLHLK